MLAAALTVLAAAYLAFGLFFFSRRRPGYNHWRDTISELGETGSRDQRPVAFAWFLPIGLVLLIVAGLLRVASPAASMLALAIAIGYIGAALFRCDPGSPLS